MNANITRHGFGLTILMFVVFFALFVSHSPIVAPDDGSVLALPLEQLVRNFSAEYPVVATLLLGVVILISAVMLAVLVSRNMVHAEKTYLPITMYLFVGGGMLCSVSYLNVFISAFLVVCSASILFGSFANIGSMSGVFNAAVLLGVAPLFYPPSVIFILSLPVAMILLRLTGRMWIVALGGVLLPVAIYSYVGWIVGNEFMRLVKDILCDVMLPVKSQSELPVSYIVFCAVVGVLFVLTVILCVKKRHTMRTRAMKTTVYSFWMLAFSVLMFAFPSRSLIDMAFVAIPASILLPGIFIRTERVILSNVLYLCFLLALLAVNLG